MDSTAGPQAAYWVIEKDDYDAHPFIGLINAVESRDVGLVRQMLANGLSPDAPAEPFSSSSLTPPIVAAVCAGHRDVMQLLLDMKASMDVRDVGFGGTVLHWAAATGDADLLRYVLERYPKTEATTYTGLTALHIAAQHTSDACLRALLEDNANPNAVDHRGESPLHMAATSGNMASLAALLARHADPNLGDLRGGETPLLRAARRGHTAAVEELVSKGANVDLANTSGVTALIASSFFGHDPVVRTLLQRGANARAADRTRQRTALHWAAANDHLEAVRTILGFAADTARLRDFEGASALDLAMASDAGRVAILLRSL